MLGLVACGSLLVAWFGFGVPVWPRGLLPCGWGGSLWCSASLCCVLWCCAVPWCCAVVLWCRFAVLVVLVLPSCALVRRYAVLCCAVGCPRCFRPGGGVFVLWCPVPPCQHAQKTLIDALCYPAPASVSAAHVVEEYGLVVGPFVVDPGGVVLDGVVLFVVSCLDGVVLF